MTSGGISANHYTPILFGQLPSIHIQSFLIVTGILYHNWAGMSSVYVIFFISFVLFLTGLHLIIPHYSCLSRGAERWCLWGWMYRVNNVPVPQSVLAYYSGLLTQVPPLRLPYIVYSYSYSKGGVNRGVI